MVGWILTDDGNAGINEDFRISEDDNTVMFIIESDAV